MKSNVVRCSSRARVESARRTEVPRTGSILSLILVLNGSQLLGPQASITRKLVIKGQPDCQLKTQHLKAHPLIAYAVESQGRSLLSN